MFGIAPNKLPGIIVFSRLSLTDNKNVGVYLPLQQSLFEQKPALLETTFADFFSIMIEAQKAASTSKDLITQVSRRVNKMRLKQSARPFFKYLKERGTAIGNLPDKFVELLANKFGEAAAKKLGL